MVKGEESGLAEWPCFVPRTLWYSLAFVVRRRVCRCVFVLLAYSDYSPENQNRKPTDPDKEVKKKKHLFPPLHDDFTCPLLVKCVVLSRLVLSPLLVFHQHICKLTWRHWQCTCHALFCPNVMVPTAPKCCHQDVPHRISARRTGWQEKSTDTKKLMSTRWYSLAGIAQCLTLSPFKGEQGLITGPEPLKWAYPARRITLALLFLAGLQSAGTDLE